MLTDLATIARRTGYPVVEVPGWKTRGRPGGMAGVRTITAHHTANGGAKGNYPSLRVVRDGRSGLPGPLAQLGLGVDGTVYVIAAGKCNHAGVSRATAYTNSYAIGIEAEAEGVPGDREDWPAAQWDSYVRLCRALVDAYGLDSTDVRGHKETCSPVGRKSDPSFDMARLRSQIRTLSPLRKPAPVKPTQEDDDMKWTDKVALTETDAKVWTEHAKATGSSATFKPKQLVSYSDMVRYPTLARKIDIKVIRLQKTLDALAGKLAEHDAGDDAGTPVGP